MQKINDSSSPQTEQATLRTATFAPVDVFERALSYWWLIVLSILVGGATGGLVFVLHEPLYDAQAVINGSINFTQTGNLEELQLDYALNSLGNIINSTQVHEVVLQESAARGIDFGAYGYHPYLERKATRWILRIRHPDPQIAADTVNLWAETAYDQVNQAYLHAVKVNALEDSLSVLETCLTRVEVPSIAGVTCSADSEEQIQTAMAAIMAEIPEETNASRGIPSALVYDIQQTADVPTQPTRYGLNSLLLAGGIIGLLIGALAIQTNLLEAIAKARHHG